ncbi:hypothetical protein [Pseudonocardia alni]|uniref:Uncharacterized protein n=1 Tax=Pseudonocardia alni TaxID=33907 RepID=A0A852WCS7_PSEA5|nr:hypothetical protein [Pseudonocardia antarctica]NYG04095.1 hypothetical protein [Pseudonocardia antarctica]
MPTNARTNSTAAGWVPGPLGLVEHGEPILVGFDGRSGRVTFQMGFTVEMVGGVVDGPNGAGQQ